MMLFPFIILVCGGFFQFTNAGQIGRKPAFDFFSTPPRNIFLKDVHSMPSFHKDAYAAHPSLKIVNGQPAARGQFCYQAYLQFSDGYSSWSCGGSLVTRQLILTAAHCIQGATQGIAVLGGCNLSQYYEPGRVVIRVNEPAMQYHEGYDSKTIYNDIGVIKLPQPVEVNEYVCTVKLPSSTAKLTSDSDNKNNYTVSGWGKTGDKKYTSKLMYVVVPGEPQDNCTSFYKKVARYNVIESQMCTSGAGMKGTCNGDSGGPLVQPDSSGNIIQQGIVSLGLNTCEYSAPSVYTDLSHYLDWVLAQM